MQCEQVRELLSLFMMGDLDDRAGRAMRSHLRDCPDCRDLLAELTDIGRALEQEKIPDPGEAFWKRFENSVMAEIDRNEPGKRFIPDILERFRAWVRRFEPVTAAGYAAAVGVVALLGFLFVRQAQVHFAEPAGMYAGIDLPAVEATVPEEPLSVALEGMDEAELSRVWSAVASSEMELDLPDTVVDPYGETVTEVAYSTYSELEYMEEDELLELELAIERWREDS